VDDKRRPGGMAQGRRQGHRSDRRIAFHFQFGPNPLSPIDKAVAHNLVFLSVRLPEIAAVKPRIDAIIRPGIELALDHPRDQGRSAAASRQRLDISAYAAAVSCPGSTFTEPNYNHSGEDDHQLQRGHSPASQMKVGDSSSGSSSRIIRTLLKAGQLQSPDQLLRAINVGGCMPNFIDIPILDLF
jgi:hypothetical protein